MAEPDAGWVTVHGPKIEHKRRQGELNAALARGVLASVGLERYLRAPPVQMVA